MIRLKEASTSAAQKQNECLAKTFSTQVKSQKCSYSNNSILITFIILYVYLFEAIYGNEMDINIS